MAERKLIELLIDEESDNFGVEAISLVKYPAIESNFIYFSKVGERRAMYAMASVDEDKRTLIGPALIPNKHIPRYDEFSGEEYDVYFSESTVSKAAELFLKTNRANNHTFEHQSPVDGVSVVESWIVTNPKMDKSYHFGMEQPQGTWMVRVHVENDEMWKFVKENQVSGFSIEGYFLDKIEKMSDRPTNESFSRKIQRILTGRKFYAEITTDNGQHFATESDKFEAGSQVYKIGPEGTPLEVENGQYLTMAGTKFEVFDGVVTEWGEKKETAEETSNLDAMKQQMRQHFERQMAKRTALSSYGIKDWWIYLDPYDYDYRGNGFYIYPFQHNSYRDYLDALSQAKEAVPMVEEWENADSDGFFEFTTNGVGITEQAWDLMKSVGEFAQSVGMPFEKAMQASADMGQMDGDGLEDRYYGQFDSMIELAYELISEGNMTDNELNQYFDFAQFGADMVAGGDLWEIASEMAETEEGQEDWYDDHVRMDEAKLGEYLIYEYYGANNPSDVVDARNYVDADKVARDLKYDFTLIEGYAFRDS